MLGKLLKHINISFEHSFVTFIKWNPLHVKDLGSLDMEINHLTPKLT